MTKEEIAAMQEIFSTIDAARDKMLRLIYRVSAEPFRVPGPVQGTLPLSAVAPPEDDPEITQKAAIAILHIGTKKLIELCDKKKIPFYQAAPGARRIFRKSEVIAYKQKKGGRP